MADETGTKQVRRPAITPAALSRFIMIFLGLLAIWTLFDPVLAGVFAGFAGAILMPLIGFGGLLPVLTLLLAGVLTTTISSVLRDYFTDWVRQARTQKVMRSWQKERLDAMRKGNQARLAKLAEAQRGFQSDLMQMQLTPLKSMALTLFLFIVIFNWLQVFVRDILFQIGNMWIAVPWSSNAFLLDAYVLPAWLLLYSLLAVPFSLIVGRVLKYVRFRRRLREMGVPLRPDADTSA